MTHTNSFVEDASCDPWKYFKSPEEVVANNDLSPDEKFRILESWKDICQKIKVAEDDGMRDVPNDLLPKINDKICEIKATHSIVD
ncbi:MAG: hypothetical protein A2X86_08400 [Bdellovibrionales bacterium GWA2_49_15]|nr:MAG: hypothetical protein A2X86_08400 [Bdellovibrionales bacterium GWA2_49_15]HAZ11218.1 hypothetical protein [Bdellovibrionales bacterium]